MSLLVLVRHAEPLVGEDDPPSSWPLNEQGRRDAQALGERITARIRVTQVWTSPERKAVQTAALAFPSVASVEVAALREVDRPWSRTVGGHVDAGTRYLRGDDVPDWEPRAAVRTRLDALEAEATGVDGLVLVSHGLLLATWLHAFVGFDDAASFWSTMRQPDAWTLDVETRLLEQVG